MADGVQPIDDELYFNLPEPRLTGPLDNHKRELFIALKTGQIRAKGIFWGEEGQPYSDIEDETVEINPNFWEWERVDWEQSQLEAPQNFKVKGSFNCITLSTSRLMHIFPLETPSTSNLQVETAEILHDAANQTTSLKQSSRRGRPTKYDWPEFYAEVIVRADLDGLPQTQAELERAMTDWCSENWGEPPGESTIREKLAPIYNHKRKARN